MDASSTNHYVQLHVHSEYSLLDGAIGISDLVKKAKKLGHQAVALTDHGNMFGAIEFYGKCKDNGIKPILGTELYWEGVAASRELSKNGLNLVRSMDAFHLVVLARSKAGYHSLCRVVSSAYLQASENDPIPTVKEEHLRSMSQDLVAMSSCLRGEFGSLMELLAHHSRDPLAELQAPSEELAPIVTALTDHVAAMRSIFGEDGYYIELIDNNIPQQKRMLPILVAAARHFGLPLVATSDAHYLNPEDSEAHAVLTGIKNDLTMRRLRHRIQNAEFHLFSNEEMEARYG
ncbi:MAG: PHP domain-containing protein, partial [Pseudobdellovibrionaceae bacterium]|nr:PHP domain-containing protein [Pseudobdellovibrionaceae bacterium]